MDLSASNIQAMPGGVSSLNPFYVADWEEAN